MSWFLIVLIIVFALISGCYERFSTGTLPMSGSEPEYQPDEWTDDIQKYNNCYSYLLDDPIKDREKKPQPGYYAGIKGPLEYGSCKKIINRMKKDNSYIYLVNEKDRCKLGWYKGYLALDPANSDYHFYRQDDNGIWSHKPGSKKVRQYDGKFRVIWNPRLANKRYNPYYYTKECGYVCVPENGFIKTNSR